MTIAERLGDSVGWTLVDATAADFHLAGTEYDHDQSTHAGGGTRRAYEAAVDDMITDPLADIHGIRHDTVSSASARAVVKFYGPAQIADQMTPLEQRMLNQGLGTVDDLGQLGMQSSLNDTFMLAEYLGLEPRKYRDLPMGVVFQAAHIGKHIQAMRLVDYQTHEGLAFEAEGVIEEFHDAINWRTRPKGSSYVGEDDQWQQAIGDLTYELESRFGISPAAGFIGALNRSWTESSQGHLSQAHQIAVAGLRNYDFAKDGTPEAMDWLNRHPEYPSGLRLSKMLYTEWQPAFDAAASATYRYTQNQLPASVDYVTLYRGVRGIDSVNTEYGDFAVEINPLSSWSASPDTAWEFGGNNYVFETRVPREMIYTTAAISGLGSLPEYETIVTADDMLAARLVNRHPSTDRILSLDEMYDVIHGDLGNLDTYATRVVEGVLVVPVDQLDADWLRDPAHRRDDADFHLQGQHDQKSHGNRGGRARGQNGARAETWEFDHRNEIDRIERGVLEDTMNQLAALHAVSDDRLTGTTVTYLTEDHPMFGRYDGLVGGGFLPTLPGAMVENLPADHNRPWIFVASGNGMGFAVTDIVHEYGHRVDAIKDDDGYDNYIRQDTPAVNAFLSAAAASPTLRSQLDSFDGAVDGSGRSYASYWGSPEEVWARAYAQWAGPQLTGTAADMFEAGSAGTFMRSSFFLPDDEFEAIGPLVEGVLRERGLL